MIKQEDPLFWQARILITQAPYPLERKEDNDYEKEDGYLPYYNLEKSGTFLMDQFGFLNSQSYGLELTAEKKLSWVFYTKAKSIRQALKRGHAWFSELKYQFLGLDGEVKAIPIDNKYLNELQIQNRLNLEEIVLPEGILKTRVNLIEKFTSLFYFIKRLKIKLYFIWRRNPRSVDDNIQYKHFNYFLRIFIQYNKTEINQADLAKLRGNIEFLCLNLESIDEKKAKLMCPNNINILKILSGDVFENYSDWKNITQDDIKFEFPEHLPLPRLPILKNENVRYIDLDAEFIENAIPIGHHIKNGVITDHITYIPINKFSQDCTIFGKSGSGKTYFLAKLIRELCKKTKGRGVGIIALNVAKENQDIFYRDFSVLKFSDDDFHIPYFFNDDKNNFEKRLQETATYICASLGLKNVFEKLIYRSMVGIIRLEGILPASFYILLKVVENYMENNSYGPEEQANLMQAFRNRMNVFEEDKIQEVLKFSESVPNWITDWMNGVNIYLDLSMCSKFIKLLIVNAIFQLIRTITKDIEADELRNLIIIDEAHAILEKPITTNSDDADFIMKEQMSKIFSELLKEYRSRGVGFIIADQSPERLFDDVSSQPSIKILLRLDYPNNLLFSEDPEERQMLSQLQNRLALVINGTTGEKYLIKTLNFVRDD